MHTRQRRVAYSLALLAGGLLLARPSLAASRFEVEAGRSYMDSNGTTAVFVEDIGEARPMGSTALNWAPVLSLGWIEGRDIARFDSTRYRTRPSTEILAAGARWHLSHPDSWYSHLYVGFQLAYNHDVTQALSSHYQFVSSLGWQGRHLSFQIRHISNGSLHEPNRGETMALVGIAIPP